MTIIKYRPKMDAVIIQLVDGKPAISVEVLNRENERILTDWAHKIINMTSSEIVEDEAFKEILKKARTDDYLGMRQFAGVISSRLRQMDKSAKAANIALTKERKKVAALTNGLAPVREALLNIQEKCGQHPYNNTIWIGENYSKQDMLDSVAEALAALNKLMEEK